jgi:hypothetical protein
VVSLPLFVICSVTRDNNCRAEIKARAFPKQFYQSLEDALLRQVN